MFIQNQRHLAFGCVCWMLVACGNVASNTDGGGMDAASEPATNPTPTPSPMPACPLDRQWCYHECANLRDDSNNCGGCGRICPSGQTCVRGSCVLICPAGERPCGPICSTLQSDNANCGACGRMCSAGTACMNGNCVTTCRAGLTGCNGGCQDLANDRHHCGSCTRDCGDTLFCSGGTCACPPGQTNCAGTCRDLAVDGRNCGVCGGACPSGRVCSMSDCVISCGTGQTDCGGSCRDLASDNQNCGACGRVCTGDRTCRGGSCVLACPARHVDCSGICRNVYEDPMHCGLCGRVCVIPHATGLGCDYRIIENPRWCSFAGCESGWANCDGGRANGCETSLTTATSCGACGSACGANMTCNTDSVCVCNAGYGNCDGNPANGCETDFNRDALNCGACGRTCFLANAGAICADGRCAITACNAGWADCDHNPDNGCETNIRDDAANCGACGNACSVAAHAASMWCNGGHCAVTSCESQWANCDGSPTNGCEVNIQTDARNCNSCGFTCATNMMCSSGGCVCEANRGDCDGNAANGCETMIRDNSANCGACGIVCGPVMQCSVGACICSSTGWADCDGNRTNGCETYLPNSITNCGACGNICPTAERRSATCLAGVCGSTCASGYFDCGSDCIPSGTCCTNSNCSEGRICPAPGSSCVCPDREPACEDPWQCPAAGTACLPYSYAFGASTSYGCHGFASPCGHNMTVTRDFATNRVSSDTLSSCTRLSGFRAGARVRIQFDYRSYADSCWNAPYLEAVAPDGRGLGRFNFGPSRVLESCRAEGSATLMVTLPNSISNFQLIIGSGDWCASVRITSITVL